MQLRPVQSSRIKAIGYDEDTWTCYVQFQPTAREPKGTIYAYAHVPPHMFDHFVAAPSKGRYFGEHLSDREEHPALRLGEPHTPSQPLPAGSGVLMFRPTEATTSKAEHAKKLARSSGGAAAQGALASSTELMQLAHERELLLEFFRPMRESTLAAYRAVIEKEEEALAQFQAAEAALVAQGQQNSKKAGSSARGR